MLIIAESENKSSCSYWSITEYIYWSYNAYQLLRINCNMFLKFQFKTNSDQDQYFFNRDRFKFDKLQFFKTLNFLLNFFVKYHCLISALCDCLFLVFFFRFDLNIKRYECFFLIKKLITWPDHLWQVFIHNYITHQLRLSI